jgi:hypothetical protein
VFRYRHHVLYRDDSIALHRYPPYDPNNPPFLGISAAFVRWLLTCCPPLLCAVCLAACGRIYLKAVRLRRPTPQAEFAGKSATANLPKPLPVQAPDGVASVATQKKPFNWDPECKQILFQFQEGLQIEITPHPNGSQGLLLFVINDSPKAIGAFSAEIVDAHPGAYI